MQDSPKSDLLPNLFLIGAPKAATTALADLLSRSREVDLGKTKEPGILVNDSYGEARQRGLYRAHFAGCEASRFRLDATPWTFYSARAPEIIDGLGPRGATQILLSLRDPLGRIQSMYADQVLRGRERRTYEDALKDSMRGVDQPLALSYVATSCYGKHLERWLDWRSAELGIVFFEHAVDPGRAPGMIDAIGRRLGISLGPLQPANVRATRSPILARPIDAAVSAGSRLPAGVKARLRPGLSAVARQILRRSPSREVDLPSTVISDAALRRDLESLLAADRRLLRSRLTPGLLLLPELPEWMDGE